MRKLKSYEVNNTLKKYLPLLTLILILTLAPVLISTPALAIEAQREVLHNGLILLFSERDNLPIVKTTLLIKASPLNEPAEKAGLANLTAELLMEGTKSRTSEDISEGIEFIGAGLDVSVDRDYTEISLSVLKKDIRRGFEILSDVLLNPTFPGKEISRKKAIIKGSLRQMEEDPGFVASRKFRRAIFGTHPYGRLVEGRKETIDSITRDDIVKFYNTYYHPNNAILSIVGDLNKKELRDLVEKYLDGWRKASIPEVKKFTVTPRGKPLVITVDRKLTQANIILGNPGIRRSNPDYYAVSVMNYILGGGGFASRLMAKIRDDMGLAYDVRSAFSSDKYAGVFYVGVQTKNRSARKVINVILEEIKRIRNEPVTTEELSDAKAYLTGSFPRRLDTMGKIAGFLALTEFYGLGIDYDIKYPEYINAVTKEDVQRVARRYMDPEDYVLVVVADIKKTGIQK